MPNKLILTVVIVATLLSATAKAIATSRGGVSGGDVVSQIHRDSAR